jgi:hypothetical protein
MSISIKLCNRCKSRFPAYVLEQNSGYCEKCYLDSIEKGKQAFLQLQLKSSIKSSSHKEIKTSWVTVIILSSILLVMMISCIPESSNKEHIKLDIDKKIHLFKDDVIRLKRVSGSKQINLLDYSNKEKITENLLWINPILENCNSYLQSKNDIQRSNYYNLNAIYISNLEIKNLKMGIGSIETNKGGSVVHLEFYEQYTDLMLIQKNIPFDSEIYKSAENFERNECVIVSGKIWSAASLFEKSEVCNPHYRIRLTDLQKCAQ